MTYRGQVTKGQILLDEPIPLPDGAIVRVEITEPKVRITRPKRPERLRKFDPITMPGGSLADDLVSERR
ncbi:MAG TPA: hypothetical protein VHQ47_11985 [Phycisphaerae bacterium]|nr:hypothetical protein [Phycisphaerae bacterium]